MSLPIPIREQAADLPFDFFTNEGFSDDGTVARGRLECWPEPPPWRQFLTSKDLTAVCPQRSDQARWKQLDLLMRKQERDLRRGAVFRLPHTEDGERVRLAVNAAIHLRRPLLVTGDPGSGKTSLAYAIAWELALGPVLTWPINPRSRLREDGLYRYDALGRLQDTRLDAENPKPRSIGDYITLGPVGTAFLPSRWPRVLLIDEIDKADLQLPNELLHLFEEGQYSIDELVRHAGQGKGSEAIKVRTADPDLSVSVRRGVVRCHEFPLVVMTSNRERDFPAAFNRRCLRVEMPRPTAESLIPLVKAHFRSVSDTHWGEGDSQLMGWVQEFLGEGNRANRAIDQLLHAVYLRTHPSGSRPTEQQMETLHQVLQKPPGEAS